MNEVDISSFIVCKGSGYAKDKNHVYYPLSVTCEEGTEFSGCYFENYIVEGADPGSFKYLGNGYAVDKNNMFYEGKASFHVLAYNAPQIFKHDHELFQNKKLIKRTHLVCVQIIPYQQSTKIFNFFGELFGGYINYL